MSIASEIVRISTNINNAYTALESVGIPTPTVKNSSNLVTTVNSAIPRIPTTCAGLCFWLDGDCNTRNGVNRSVRYFENLMYNEPYSPANGNMERWKPENTGSWNADKPNMLNVGANAIFPDLYNSDELTIETALMYTNSNPAPSYIVNTRANNVGFYFEVTNTGVNLPIYLSNRSLNSTTKITYNGSLYNTPNYLCATINKNTGNCSLRQGMTNICNTSLGSLSIRTATNVCTGIFGNAAPSSSFPGAKYAYITVGMVRVWTRVLSENEILKNYNDAKARFGCV